MAINIIYMVVSFININFFFQNMTEVTPHPVRSPEPITITVFRARNLVDTFFDFGSMPSIYVMIECLNYLIISNITICIA